MTIYRSMHVIELATNHEFGITLTCVLQEYTPRRWYVNEGNQCIGFTTEGNARAALEQLIAKREAEQFT